MTQREVLVGRIHTGTTRGWTEALAIADGTVERIGAEAEVRAGVPEGTPVRRVDTVVPGLVDSHIHVLWGGRGLNEVDVSAATSIDQVLDGIAAFARDLPGDAWVLGDGGFDELSLRERRMPTLAELDVAAGGRPLLLGRRAHDALVNTEGLRRAGITAQTADPEGGHILRDVGGAPTGLLLERPAVALVEAVVPPAAADDAVRWIIQAQRPLLEKGITAVADPALRPMEIDYYVRAYHREQLMLRTTVFPLGSNDEDPYELDAAVADTGIGSCDAGILRVGPVKLFVDGAGALGTALRHEPWPGTDSVGIQTITGEALDRYAEWAWREGRGLGVHTVGPRAVELALDAFAKASDGKPWPRGRVHLIHAYLEQTPELMARASALGVGAALQPALNASVAREVNERLGGRADIVDVPRWLRSGTLCGGGSDGPGLEIDPFVFIAGLEGELGRDAAVRFYTGDSAAVIGASYGTLVPGAPADLIELSDPWEPGQMPARRRVRSSLAARREDAP